MDGTTIDDFHGRLFRDTFGRRLGDRDMFLVFVLFHTWRIVFSSPILKDRPGVREIEADTQRGVSGALASAWVGTEDERAQMTFWYFRWNGDWGSYNHAYCLTSEEQQRLAELRADLERHPFVSRLETGD